MSADKSGHGAGVGSFTFLVPAWNEESSISRVVSAAISAGGKMVAAGQVDAFEILIVDDGSTDSTPAILEELAGTDPRISLTRHPSNRGLGAALRTGMETATGDVILYTDADLPFDLQQTGRLLRLMRTHDAEIVSAFRIDRTSEGPRRTLYSFVYNSAVRVLLGVKARDVNFAAKLMDRSSVLGLGLRSEGSFIDAELLARASVAGMHVIQVGVDYFPRRNGASTLSGLDTIVEIVREIVRLAPGIRRQRREARRHGPSRWG